MRSVKDRCRCGQGDRSGGRRRVNGGRLGRVLVVEWAVRELNVGQRPVGVAKARQLLDRVRRVNDVDHITRLHKVQDKSAIRAGQVGSRVRRRDFIRGATRLNLALIRVEPDVLVAELQDERLRDVELELDQPGTVGAVLYLGNVTRPRTTDSRPLDGRDKVLKYPAAVLILGDVNPSIHEWRQLARVEGRANR